MTKVFEAMEKSVKIEVEEDEEEKLLQINHLGDEMGLLIGKMRQTLDSFTVFISSGSKKRQ